MTLFKSLLLGSAAGIVAIAGASAADLPSKKAAPATYVKICDAYGAGFFYIPGTDTCVKVGGYVRVDYDYRPERKGTATVATTAVLNTAVANGTTNSAGLAASATPADNSTSGFYNRGTIQLDARTPTSMGVARTFMALRLETGSGPQAKSATQPSLEAAYVQWAGFTAGQGAQPFAYMSSWAYNTHFWGGWPNGVRQLTYTAVLGGGISTTFGITDAHNYNAVTTAAKDATNGGTAKTEAFDGPGYNGVIYVGNVRYDQSWGNVQVMAAGHTGGDLTGGTQNAINNVVGGTKKSGYAVGAGATFKLPMLAAGDEIQLTAVYADRLANLLADSGINTPSASAYGTNPIGGPSVKFEDGTGWVVGAQLRHYWASNFRSQVYASYTSREQNFLTGGVKGSGTAYSLGKAFIYSPAKDFDIGLEFNYIRAEWDQAAVRSAQGTTLTVNNMWSVYPAQSANNYVTKLRIQRNF